MSYYGRQDRKSIVYLLDNGLASLKDKVIEATDDEVSSLWSEFRQLEKVLYGEGKVLLSMSNKVRFESRLNTIRKKLEKLSAK